MPRSVALWIILGGLFLVLFPLICPADQRDSSLNEIFTRLRVTENPVEAILLGNAIWSTWVEHEDRRIKHLMSKAGSLIYE